MKRIIRGLKLQAGVRLCHLPLGSASFSSRVVRVTLEAGFIPKAGRFEFSAMLAHAGNEEARKWRDQSSRATVGRGLVGANGVGVMAIGAFNVPSHGERILGRIMQPGTQVNLMRKALAYVGENVGLGDRSVMAIQTVHFLTPKS
jgi:hypothetical protein